MHKQQEATTKAKIVLENGVECDQQWYDEEEDKEDKAAVKKDAREKDSTMTDVTMEDTTKEGQQTESTTNNGA